MSIQSFRDLIVWQKSIRLVESVYELTRSFPREELYGLTSQLRKSVISVPSNIAEGHGRSSRKDYASFVAIAKGSLLEVETQLIIAAKLGFTTEGKIQSCLDLSHEIERMLATLRARLVGVKSDNLARHSP